MSELELPATEDEARAQLLRLCWPSGERHCARCGHPKPYHLKDGRYRCPACRYTFHDFTGRWLNRCNLSASEWCRLAALFVEDRSALEIGRILHLSNNTTLRALNTIRFGVVSQQTDFDLVIPALLEDEARVGLGRDRLPTALSGLILVVNRAGESMSVAPMRVMDLSDPARVQQQWRQLGIFVVSGSLIPGAVALGVLPPPVQPAPVLQPFNDQLVPDWFVESIRGRLVRVHPSSVRRWPLLVLELAFRQSRRRGELYAGFLEALCGRVPHALAGDHGSQPVT